MRKFIATISILLIVTSAHAQTYTVERVIDGNTLKLTNGEEVRLIGIDTSKMGQPLDSARGKGVTEFVEELMAYKGDTVKLETDVGERDKYDRLLAYAYKLVCLHPCRMRERKGYEYESFKDGVYIFVNATILKSGYATPMTIPPNVKYAELFERLYQEAMENKRGLWKDKEKIEIDNERFYYTGTVRVEEKSLKDGIKAEKVYYQNGNLKSEENHKNGKRHGVRREYYEDGGLWLEQYYDEGKLLDELGNPVNGMVTYYWKNGKVFQEANFKEGRVDGFSKMYSVDGALAMEEQYKDGKRDGAFKMYYGNGDVASEGYYKENKMIKSKSYDEEGNLIAEKISEGE